MNQKWVDATKNHRKGIDYFPFEAGAGCSLPQKRPICHLGENSHGQIPSKSSLKTKSSSLKIDRVISHPPFFRGREFYLQKGSVVWEVWEAVKRNSSVGELTLENVRQVHGMVSSKKKNFLPLKRLLVQSIYLVKKSGRNCPNFESVQNGCFLFGWKKRSIEIQPHILIAGWKGCSISIDLQVIKWKETVFLFGFCMFFFSKVILRQSITCNPSDR